MSNPIPPGIALCAQLACVWEVTARKPGNVHRYADFADATYLDFIASAAAIGPVLHTAPTRRLGATVLEAVRATCQVTGTNTNLGIILLLAPLAAVPEGEDLPAGVRAVLDRSDVADSQMVYEAIRLANPGGLGTATQQDVAAEPTLPLRAVMALAADRDLVARQYVENFHTIFAEGLPALVRGLETTGSLEGGIIAGYLDLLIAHPDSLVARKCGTDVAAAVGRRARDVLQAGWPRAAGRAALAEFDAWLRGDGHRRNPGTTADLVTASLFAALRGGSIQVPLSIPFGMP